jgi:hypothetical protein
MISIASTAKFVPTAIAAAAIGLGALMTVGVPSAHASEKSDCDAKGGTFTQTELTWNGKPATVYRCCVKDAATNTTSCTSTTVTKNALTPVTVRPGVIGSVENIEPANVEPAPPIQRVPLEVLNTDAQIQPAP